MAVSDEIKSYRARWIAPMDQPPIEDGVLSVRGNRIHSVEQFDRSRSESVEDLGDVLLLPGFINAHTHLELGFCRGRIPPCPLWDWFDQLIRLNSEPDSASKRRQSVIDGVRESLEAGVTYVADISRTGDSAELLANTPIRKTCFVELISGARNQPNDVESLAQRLSSLSALQMEPTLRLGVSPHAPYSVTPDDLTRTASLAVRMKCPLTMHVLETKDESEWLESGTGRVGTYLSKYGIGNRSSPGTGALTLLERCGILGLRPLLAHLNYTTNDDISRLKAIGAGVVWCPRTHDYFGHPPHRWREMLLAGLSVCIGTDSLASAHSLSILEELRYIHAIDPKAPPWQLVELATRNAAMALGVGQELGTLSRGKLADFVSISVTPDGPSDCGLNILKSKQNVNRVWIDGETLYTRE